MEGEWARTSNAPDIKIGSLVLAPGCPQPLSQRGQSPTSSVPPPGKHRLWALPTRDQKLLNRPGQLTKPTLQYILHVETSSRITLHTWFQRLNQILCTSH